MLDVAALVQQMRDTLSEIHDTITSLDTKGHDEKLDALESQRDDVFRQLQSAFEKESAELKQRRQAERDEIAEKRRREDEEIAARRRTEDEEKATRDHEHDAEREHELDGQKEGVEQETDEKMDRIEEEARRMLDEGHNKLKDLEERRREINRMIDEQMKAPLPPPPARRARRSTRASQGGVPGQTDSSRRLENTAPLEAESQDRTREFDTSDSRGIEPEKSRGDGLTHAEPKPIELQQESSSPQQASAEGSVGLHESTSDKPASHDDQNQTQETVSIPQPGSGSDRGISEATAEDHAHAADQVTGEDSSSQAPEQAAPSSEKSEQQGETAIDSAHGDVGDSVQKSLAEDEPAAESPDVKERELDSDGSQERPHSRNGDASIGTWSQSQDQAAGAENKGADISSDTAGQSAEPPAADDHQEAPSSRDRPDLSERPTTSEVHTPDEPAHEEDSDNSRSQPSADGPTALDSPPEHEEPKGSDDAGLLQGVVKGGAAEEYVKMAEAESGQEPQFGANTSATPEQDSSSGNGQQRESQDEISSRGVEQSGPIQVNTSTTDQESSDHTRQVQADERPSSASGPADSVEAEARSPVGSEHESSHLRSRDVDGLDQQGTRHEPTPDLEKHLQSSSEQSELDHSRDLGSSPTGGDKHEQPSAPSQSSPDVGTSNGDQLQESGYGEHPQSGDASPESGLQSRDLNSTYPQETEEGGAHEDETSVSEKGPSEPQSTEDQQRPHGNEQRDISFESVRGEQEHPGHDIASQLESDPMSQQSSSAPAASGHDAQLEKDRDDNRDNGSFGGHESSQERQEPRTPNEDRVSVDSGEEVPQPSSQDIPNIVKPNDLDALPHESASEQEPGDKRSDSGYETGMASSRNLEDSTTTLHEDQHEHQPAQGAEHSLASAPPENGQEKTRESRPEQILEGSGKDVSPPRLGGEQQDSDDHPVEETFDLSGNEPIPGTMTHGKDQTEDQGKELADGDVSLQDTNHQQPVDNDAVGAAVGTDQRGAVIDESHENQRMEESLPHESSRQPDDDHVQPECQPMAHEVDDTISAGSRSQGAEEQVQQGDSQSAAGAFGQGSSSETESSLEPSATAEPQHPGSTPNTGQAEQLHHEDDIESTTSRGMDEPQQDTSVGDDGAGVPTSQKQISEPSHVSDSPSAHGLGSDQFGSWDSQAFSRPADDNEFSFKKRADSVQVGRSHGPADRGADLPSINTDGPNEDADEGLFVVPPTPRHEVDHEKPSQLQADGESKPSSRASSRANSPGADALSPRAAEGLQDPSREENGRENPPETAATKDNMHHNVSHSTGDGPQENAVATETSDRPDEKTVVSDGDSEELSNRGELDHGQPDHGQPKEPSITKAEEQPHKASAGNDNSQQGQQHNANSPQSPEEQLVSSERHLDDSLRHETSSGEQHTSDTSSKPDVNDDKGETQVVSDNQARDTTDHPEEEPYELSKEHDLEQDGSGFTHLGEQSFQSSDDAKQRDVAEDDSRRQEMDSEPNSEQIQPESGEIDNRSLGDNDQVQSESRTFKEDRRRSVSLEDEEPASVQDLDKRIADPPQLDQGGTQQPESGLGSEGEQHVQDHANIDRAAHQRSPDHSSQHLDARQANYDGEGYGVTPSSEYSDDPLADPAPREKVEAHSADDSATTRQSDAHGYDLPDSARATRNDDPMDSGSENFETPLESADFRKPQEDSRSVTPGHFTQALDHLPDESAHTVQGTDDLFDDTDDAEDADDYGEAVVYQHSNEGADGSPSGERTVYSTRGDENNTALGGHRSSLSLGSVGHRSQGSISSMRDTTPVRPTFGSYIGGPSIVRADWAAEHEDELRPSSLNPTPQLGPSTTHDTPEISPFALRNTPMPSQGNEQRGLDSSMWNPGRPQTPTSATSRSNNPFATPQRQAESDFDPSPFVPRDVTHGRQDSVPASLHSQTTLDSSWSSPVHSSLPVDRHEPVIRDSWPAPAPGYQQYLSSWSSRPRGDTTSTAAEYDPFKPDNDGAPGGHTAAKPSSSYNPFLQRGRAESSVSATPSNPSVSNSPSRGSALFAKMRNIFESQTPNDANDVPASPGKTRPVSGVFHPVASAQRKSQDSATGPRDDERGGFLNEADHEIDERSAFLRSDGQPSGH